MQTSAPLPGSLFELIVNRQPAQATTSVSPPTFKSLVSSLIGLLIERQIRALVWAKLPRNEIWQEELQQYSQISDLSQAIYSLKSPTDEDSSEESTETSAATTANASDKSNNADSDITYFKIPGANTLRREYLLFIWSKEIQVAVVARRIRLRRGIMDSSSVADMESIAGDPTTEDSSDKKQVLDLLTVFGADAVRNLLSDLQRLLVPTIPAKAPSDDEPAALASRLNSWNAQIDAIAPEPIQPLLISTLLARHLQQQDENGQRATLYRKQAEQTEFLQLQNEELMNAVRFKDDFLNNIGQELRTPLTTIKTALTLLSSPSLRPPQRQRYMDLIAKECDRQSSLITSLLELVQIDQAAKTVSIEPLRLSEIVPGVVSTYQPLAEEKGVMLAYTIPEELPAIASVNAWVKQIVIHLLHNGIKFTPRGGQVWVRARHQDPDTVQLEIRDTGVGIPGNEVPKIFERFYRVRQTSAEDSVGAGLGLTIVQQLLIHCGGSINVKSRPGEGSIFTVSLPVHKSSTSE